MIEEDFRNFRDIFSLQILAVTFVVDFDLVIIDLFFVVENGQLTKLFSKIVFPKRAKNPGVARLF
jgi:hypothetical protein